MLQKVLPELEHYETFVSYNEKLISSAPMGISPSNELIYGKIPKLVAVIIKDLLKENFWTKYEMKFLKKLLEIAEKSFKDRNVLKMSGDDFIELSKYGYESFLERAEKVKNSLIDVILENNITPRIVFALDTNIELLKFLKETVEKVEEKRLFIDKVKGEELFETARNVFCNVRDIYVLIHTVINKEIESEESILMIDNITKKSLLEWKKYHNKEEILIA